MEDLKIRITKNPEERRKELIDIAEQLFIKKGYEQTAVSDIVKKGVIYAIEKSPFAVKKLLNLCNKRKNIIPIFNNANKPDNYNIIVPQVDFIYQDISQRNQDEIFINNISKYLKINSQGIIMVKARSIDVSLKPQQVYNRVVNNLKLKKINIIDIIDLSNYEKDHAAIIVSK